MAPMTKVVMGTSFQWPPKAQAAFDEVKKRLTQALVPALSCFDEVFEVEFDAFGVGIGGVLTQESKPLVRNYVIQEQSVPPIIKSFI